MEYIFNYSYINQCTVLRNDAPCYYPEGVPTTSNEGDLKGILEQMCPKFAAVHTDVCCDLVQIESLNAKLSNMFNAANPFSLFDGCPACVRSQLEYYCNMYCSPSQKGIVLQIENYTLVPAQTSHSRMSYILVIRRSGTFTNVTFTLGQNGQIWSYLFSN